MEVTRPIETSQPVDYASMWELFKQEARETRNLPLIDFCRSHNINYKHMRKWMENHNHTVADVYGRVRHPDEIYWELWHTYEAALKADHSLTLRDFCKAHNTTVGRFGKWITRNNFSITDLRAKVGADDDKTRDFAKSFQKSLESYRKILETNPYFKLIDHCRNEHLNYQMMCKWMNNMGLTPKMLKESAILHNKLPNNRSMCYVQFRPNGGSYNDRLKGVVIKLYDGTCVSVEECTVVSLCSFINTYNTRHKEDNV